MECFLCEQDAVRECPRCGALYCDEHGEALCQRCSDPALALPSYQVYRGSLLALIVGSVFALWLLVSPPGGGDLDAATESPASAGTPLAVAPAAVPPAGATPDPTPTSGGSTATPVAADAATPEATATRPASTATAAPTSTPAPTPAATATPEPTATAPPQQVTEYEVQPGDSLILIAERLIAAGGDVDDFVDAIAALNGITDAGLIEIGEVLQIPAQ